MLSLALSSTRKLSLLNLESGEEKTPPLRLPREDQQVVVAFPLVLTITWPNNDQTRDVIAYNVLTNEEVWRTRLEDTRLIRPFPTNGKAGVFGGMNGYTLLGMPDENGGEEMWRRQIETPFNQVCVNKTCVVSAHYDVVTVEDYWMILDDDNTGEEDKVDDGEEDISENIEITGRGKEDRDEAGGMKVNGGAEVAVDGEKEGGEDELGQAVIEEHIEMADRMSYREEITS